MDIVELGMDVDSRPLNKTNAEMNRFAQQGKRVDGAARGVEKSTGSMTAAMKRAAVAIGGVTAALAGARSALRASQQYTQMTNSLRSLGMSADQASSTLGQIADVANRTRAPLEATAQLYQRISIAGRDLGATQQQVLRFSENVGLALAQTGTSASQASGALLQLSQAMAGGVVRAEEFNSILEGAFPIAQAAADGIDEAAGSVGRLRQMVIEGKISSDEFFQAILSQTDQLEAAFARTVPTIGGAMTVLNNQWTMFVGGVNSATGVAEAAARVIILAADNLERLVFWAGAAATAFGVRYVAGLVAAAKATTTLSATLTVLRGALIRTGIGALIVGAGELVYQFGRLVNATGGFGAAMAALGEVAVAVWSGIVESAKAVPQALNAVWQEIKAGFLEMTSEILWAWRGLLQSLANSTSTLSGLEVLGVRPFEGMASAIQDAANNAAKSSNDILESALSADRASRDAFSGAGDSISAGFDDARTTAAKLAETVAGASAEMGDGENAADRLNNALEEIGGGGGGGGGSAGSVAKGMEDAAEKTATFASTLQDAAMNAEEMGVERANILISGIDGIAGAFGDFVADGFRDFKGFVDSVWSSFKSLISDMIALAARNRIMLSLGVSAGGAGTAAAAGGAGGGGGLLSSLMGGGGMLGTLGSAAAGTVGTGLIGGAGNALGIGAAGFNPLAIGTNAAMAGGGAMATIGAALPLIGGVVAGLSLFIGKTKELDRGLRVTVDGMDALVETFRKTEKSRLFGLLKSRDTDFRSADAETQDAIGGMVSRIQSGIMDTASVLGIGAEAFEGFSHRFRVSLKGLSEEEQQAEIEKAVQGLADEFAAMALGSVRAVAREGETATETLERLANALIGVNRSMDMLGHQMFEASLAGADMASSLAEAFGGLQAMDSATTTFFNAFYSEAEQLEAIGRRAADALAEHNLRMPQTRDQYRAMVDALDLTTQGGREAYATLVGLADSFDRLLPAMSGVTQLIEGLIGNTSSAVDVMIAEAQAMARDAGRAAQDWFRAADSLRDFLRDLTGSQASALTPGQQFRATRQNLRQTFTAARGGDVEAAREFPGVAQDFLRSAQAQASTALEFRRIESRVRSQANLLAGIAELEGAADTAIESLTKEQIGILEDLRDYITTTEQIDPDDIASFESRLGALQGAIEQAEMFSYEYLKERLKVAVDLLVDADIPADVRRMVANAEAGIESSIEFAVRAADLTPDLRWLAVQGASEHIKTIKYVLDDAQWPEEVQSLALTTGGIYRRTIRYIAQNTMPADLTGLALADASTLLKSIKFTAQALPADVRRVVFNKIAPLRKRIDFMLGDTIPDHLQSLALDDAETFTRVINTVAGRVLPEQLQSLALSAPRDFSRTLNVLAGRLPDNQVRRLALDAATKFERVINLRPGRTVSNATARLALKSSDSITRTIRMVAAAEISADEKRIALAGSSELLRVVNATLSSDIDREAKRLALGNVGSYAVNVRAALSASRQVRQIVFDGAGSYAAMVEAAISQDMSPWARRVLLQRQGEYSVTVTAVLDSAPPAHRALLLNASTSAIRGITIATAFPDTLTEAERELLLRKSSEVLRMVQAGVDMRGVIRTGRDYFNILTRYGRHTARHLRAGVDLGTVANGPLQRQYFDQLRAGNGQIDRVLKGRVDLGSLDRAERSLLEAIQGSTAGTIRLGGSFVFDPSAAFRSTLETSITAPMDSLRGALARLREAVLEWTAQQAREAEREAEREAARRAAAAKRDAFNAELGTLSMHDGNLIAGPKQVRNLANVAGLESRGPIKQVAQRLEQYSPEIKGVVTRGTGLANYLFHLFKEHGGKVAIDRSDYLNIYRDVENEGMNPGRHFRKWGRGEILAGRRPFNPQAFDWKSIGLNIPGFADGGMHSGGLRVVGEGGPELEATGPARYYSAPQTREMLGGDPALMRELVAEVRALREEQRQLGLRSDRHGERTSKVLRKWDQLGLPQEQTS